MDHSLELDLCLEQQICITIHLVDLLKERRAKEEEARLEAQRQKDDAK